MKRTNIVMDEALVREGLKATGLKTRRALVQHALEELVRREKQTGLLGLTGKVRWTGSLATMRKARSA
jgi:Arc/MetJ family transcription regulator